MYEMEEAGPSPTDISAKKEYIWQQKTRSLDAFNTILTALRECCMKLHLGNKCDGQLNIPVTHPNSEKHALAGKHGGDNIKAIVSLLGDNVIQAEVVIKHPKGPGGTYRGVAQPDVQWKLQQLQDLANHIVRATSVLCDVMKRLNQLNDEAFGIDSGELILNAARMIKTEISSARCSILLPRKRSLLELCYFPPTRKFAPPLPQDQLLSFYISSCRLVCASYQIVPKQNANQGLSISLAECELPYLDDVIKQLNIAMSIIQRLIGDLEMCKRRAI
ncbi:unnamed protein product [Auanema sp. JU1783]|nr:unnamed protein product [Auanema sp. JU1783]